jgi:hypothetical protein
MFKCTLGKWRLEVCLVLMLCISECVKYCSLLLDTNVSRESIYCDINGKMFHFLNKLLQDFLLLHPIIILNAFLYSRFLKNVRGISPEYYSICHYSVEKGMVNHNNCICIHTGLNRSDYVASSVQFIYKWPIRGFQESVLSTTRPRNLVYRLLEILLLYRHIFM